MARELKKQMPTYSIPESLAVLVKNIAPTVAQGGSRGDYADFMASAIRNEVNRVHYELEQEKDGE